MLADCQLLTIAATLPSFKCHELSSATPVASTYSFGNTDRGMTEGIRGTAMADDLSRSRVRRAEDDTELWFNMPSSHRQHQGEQSAYRATSNRLSWSSTTLIPSSKSPSIPKISTTLDLNKSLPPPPSEADRRSHKQATLRSFLRGRSSNNQLETSHPEETTGHHNRHRSAGGHLSVDVQGYYQQQHSRSMPSSPYGQNSASTSSYPPPLARVHSANPSMQATAGYLPYDPTQGMSASADIPFEISPTRARTFPDTTVASPTTRRSSVTRKPRPHTWLSPTEPFADSSQFHLFVEATTGLPDDSDPWSPNGPNRLQSSLFARRPSNGAIPIPPQYAPAPIPDRTHQTAAWQSFEPPLISSRSVSAPMASTSAQATYQPFQADLLPHMNAINAELEMLGLDGDLTPEDDELPDYAQSQAEMNVKKREEAAARARELEARWRGARDRRS